ncbi:hypothetical protein D3C76_1140150 [compost metagenome]
MLLGDDVGAADQVVEHLVAQGRHQQPASRRLGHRPQFALVDVKAQGMHRLQHLHVLHIDIVLGVDRYRFAGLGMHIVHRLDDTAGGEQGIGHPFPQRRDLDRGEVQALISVEVKITQRDQGFQ